MTTSTVFQPGSLVRARGREWVALPETRDQALRLRPLGGGDDDATLIYLPLEPHLPQPAAFPPPDPHKAGAQAAGLLMHDALRLKLRAGAGPFRSFGNLAVEPRAYQLAPLLMALRQDTVRLLIADDVGVGKTIEAGLIARELLDRGEIERLAVICPPHLCEQWQEELAEKFNLPTEIVRTGAAGRLERGLPAGQSLFEAHPFTVVSLDYIKSERRRDEFIRACPEFVIVEEAHTCVGGVGASRHLRYQLLRQLAHAPQRHMLLLTATPHSGDEDAFHHLLGLLNPRFKALQGLPEGAERSRLRAELAGYFVQRRRPDIQEWQDSTVFPDRETGELTYTLNGAWGKLFEDLLGYARQLVERSSHESRLRQRLNFWAALALLRCASSSPAAAALALRTRWVAVAGVSEAEQLAEIERVAAETVLDGLSDSELNLDETAPAGAIEDPAEAEDLRRLIAQAEARKGLANDPKLAVLVQEVTRLIAQGFRPVVFCRYIATAHYVAEELRRHLRRQSTQVSAVTGESTPTEREARLLALNKEADGRTPVLVATDCLSEGINLQHIFNAVIHYDLVWNPTRHEQREGRVDRFGQPDKVVRALMFYGDNNPVDGAVLQVILKKAEKIRKELGVSVPMPADSNQVMETIMRAVLLRAGDRKPAEKQLELGFDFDDPEQNLAVAWESAKERAREGRRTVFAQRRLRPDEALPEWRKAVAVLGGEADVARFVGAAAERLRAPLESVGGHYRLPVAHLPAPLQERLAAVGIDQPFALSFTPAPPAGVDHIHRAHPLVAALADYVAEQALSEESPALAARCGIIFTDGVMERTTLYLLRLRSQLTIENPAAGRPSSSRQLLAEECLTVQVAGGDPVILPPEEAVRLMALTPSRNLVPEQRARQLQRDLAALDRLQHAFAVIARQRADELLADHVRVRAAGAGRGAALGQRYAVEPSLPVDVIGVYVLLPTPHW